MAFLAINGALIATIAGTVRMMRRGTCAGIRVAYGLLGLGAVCGIAWAFAPIDDPVPRRLAGVLTPLGALLLINFDRRQRTRACCARRVFIKEVR